MLIRSIPTDLSRDPLCLRYGRSLNPTVLIRSIPTFLHIPRSLSLAAGSQSHRADQVNSDEIYGKLSDEERQESQSHRADQVNSDRQYVRDPGRTGELVSIPPC